MAARFVRRQLPSDVDDQGPNFFDMRDNPEEWRQWLEDPEGTFERKLREALAQIKARRGSSGSPR